MRLLDRINSAVVAFRSGGDESPVNIDDYINAAVDHKLKQQKTGTKAVSDFPQVTQRFRVRQDIRTLETAIADAESTNYNREQLHKIYRQHVAEDMHVTSQWESRKMKTKSRDFGIFLNDESIKDLNFTQLFQKEWFYDFIDAVLDSRVWGFTLAELYNWDKDRLAFVPWRNVEGKIADAVEVIHHDYVKPETGYVVEQPGLLKGLDFFDSRFRNQLIYVGGKQQGMYWKLAKPCLFKQNSIANWSEWIEVFGLDAIVVHSKTTGIARKNLVTALQRFSSSRVAVLDETEDLKTVGANRSDAHKVFEMLGRYVDEGISKVVWGQDVVSNNTGQVVGNVGENIAFDYAEADKRLIESQVNEWLLPMMTRVTGIDFSNARFAYDRKLSTRELKEMAEVDLLIAQMGFKHNPDMINERYGVDVETSQVATLQNVVNRLKKMMPEYGGN